MGRPSKLTPKLTQEIADLLLAGAFVEAACDRVGIHRATFYRWMRRGEQDQGAGVYQEFCDTIKKAQAQAEVRMVRQVLSGSPRWRAAAWWLERRYPDRWGRQRRRRVVGDAQTAPVKVDGTFNSEDTSGVLGVFATLGTQEYQS